MYPPEGELTRETRVLEVRIYWGTILLDIMHRQRPKAITIGDTKSADVFIASDGLPVDAFPLLRTIDGECVLTFTTAMEGELELAGSVRSLASFRGTADDALEGAYRVTLPTEARAVVHWGGMTFALRFVPKTQALPNRWWRDIDHQAANLLLVSLFAHLAFIVTLLTAPRDAASLREDILGGVHQALLLEPPTMTAHLERTLTKLQDTRDQNAASIAHAERTPAKAPDRAAATGSNADKRDALITKFQRLINDGSRIDASLGAVSISGALFDVVGTVGHDRSPGVVGLGVRGSVQSVGGPTASRGIGPIGTIGKVGRLGDAGYGPSKGLGAHKDRGLASLSTPVMIGALPRELIQRVINANKAQVRYCYEVELQRDQNLEGKVAVKWIIGATGAVAQVVVTESTMRSPRVGQCLAEKIRGWRFPQPAGGGVVEVNYPFVFTSR